MPRTQNKKSRRFRLMSLPIGGVMVFPIAISSSIRAQLAEIKRSSDIAFTSEITPKQIKVTCTSRPEAQNN